MADSYGDNYSEEPQVEPEPFQLSIEDEEPVETEQEVSEDLGVSTPPIDVVLDSPPVQYVPERW